MQSDSLTRLCRWESFFRWQPHLRLKVAGQPRLGVRSAKEEIRHYLHGNRTDEGFDLELARILEITRSEDSIEGVRAFNAKRPPRWHKSAK